MNFFSNIALRYLHAVLLIVTASCIFVAMGHGGGFLAQLVPAAPAPVVILEMGLVCLLLISAAAGANFYCWSASVFVAANLVLPVVAMVEEGMNYFTILTMVPFLSLSFLVLIHFLLVGARFLKARE
ncbi:MAG: hypothetical protein GY719_34480 [bacterium]|nr:hypothetical protein [bacterium]